MRRFLPIIAIALFLTVPATAFSAVELYTGTMEIVTTSGKGCNGVLGLHSVELLLQRTDGSSEVSGYFEGDEVSTGRFSGNDPTRLPVRYPYQDEFRAAGHFIGISFDKSGMRAELRDRHVEASVDDCNFDLAKLTMSRVNDDQKADARFKRIKALFDAQLMRSEAYAMTRQGRQNSSLQLYEKALALVDSVGERNPKFLVPFITGLANGYVRAGRFKDFDRLYDERISGITDEAVRGLFTGYRVHSLLHEGKVALGREEYTGALERFQQAYRLNPLSREVIAAVMAAHVRAGRYDSAITFLEEAQKSLVNEMDRKDVRGAIALVLQQKAKKADKDGKNDEAESSLRKAVALDPENVQYLVALARLRHKAGSLEEAEELLRQGLKRFEDEPSRREILAARDRMRQTEVILKKIRETEG